MHKDDIYEDLGYSIRKRGEDEIEIRHSLLDGYIRGFFRALLLAMFLLGSAIDINNGLSPFQREIENFERKYEWTFNSDILIKPMYEDTVKFYNDPKMIEKYKFSKPLETYEEYKSSYINEFHRYDYLSLYGTIAFLTIAVLLCFIPRPRGIRVNRKKRLIYWQSICDAHSIAYVPETGDPLSGLTYSKFGLYAFGGHKRFSLQIWIKDYQSKQKTTSFYGVYPMPNPEHNTHILQTIRAYLNEDKPEFLSHIGNRYRISCFKPLIFFCNAFTWGIPFRRRKAEKALNKALDLWNSQNDTQKNGWFNHIRKAQQAINKAHSNENLDNKA
ncbi:hypothetical protein EDC44_11030 [Cricetibacter osteomyelitidis]|uniref:Uncharacterized protein n=1 Tax=Cricetibacter osteomyelitidis TaxID=1521931 RepID=A0A4R2SXF1_9PAST|nr:hypothetical protein [Cricetibacter osteomyelitidis]TCP95199.1 hypothetical protein EDC44_11030 [Cricetibacter osteomyelitidis]